MTHVYKYILTSLVNHFYFQLKTSNMTDLKVVLLRVPIHQYD